jgi:Isoleucyl-tRNA synthetase (EC 6.1.1.5)
MKYKDTLNLGKTGFPMRGSLPKTEPERQAKWYAQDLYQKRLSQNQLKPHFQFARWATICERKYSHWSCFE